MQSGASCKNEIRKLGKWLRLQACDVDAGHFEKLHGFCDQTSAFACGKKIPRHIVHPELYALLQQISKSKNSKGNPKNLYLWKAADGYILSIKRGKRGARKHEAVCLIKSDKPVPGQPRGTASAFCIMRPEDPTKYRPVRPIRDGGIVGLHEVSRVSNIDHAINKLHMLQGPSPKPRVIMHCPAVGSVRAVRLLGERATLVKTCLLHKITEYAAAAGRPDGIYDKQLQFLPGIAKMILLKDERGNVRLTPCTGGIMVYRQRPDGAKTVLLIGSSNDFAAKEQDDVGTSCLDLLKFDYANALPTGPRFFCVETRDQCTRPGMLSRDMTVQEMVGIIERYMRHSSLASNEETAQFPYYCHSAHSFGMCASSSAESSSDDDGDEAQFMLAPGGAAAASKKKTEAAAAAPKPVVAAKKKKADAEEDDEEEDDEEEEEEEEDDDEEEEEDDDDEEAADVPAGLPNNPFIGGLCAAAAAAGGAMMYNKKTGTKGFAIGGIGAAMMRPPRRVQ